MVLKSINVVGFVFLLSLLSLVVFTKKTFNESESTTVKIMLTGTIRKDNVQSAISQLVEAKNSGVENVTLIISSYGGSVVDGNTLIDYLENLEFKQVTTYCLDVCASMAAHIFMAGNTRIMAPSASVLFHPMSLTVTGNLEDVNNYLELVNRIKNKLNNKVLSKLTNQKHIDFIKRSLTEDIWITADDMLEMRLIDKTGVIF